MAVPVAAAAALRSVIAAIPTLSGGLVREGFPTEPVTEYADRVYVMHLITDGKWTQITEQRTLAESFGLQVTIHARTYFTADANGITSKTRAFQIRDLIVAAIRADPELGGAVQDIAPRTFTSQTGVPEGANDGWITELTLGLEAADWS